MNKRLDNIKMHGATVKKILITFKYNTEFIKTWQKSVYKLPSGEEVSVADKTNSSRHTILRQTAKLLYPQDVTLFTESDSFIACQVIICLV
jgi:hypothetical protein